MTTISKADRLDVLFAEGEQITAQINAIFYDAGGQVRYDTTAAEEVHLDKLFDEQLKINRRMATITTE